MTAGGEEHETGRSADPAGRLAPLREPVLARYFAARAVSQIGDWAARLALAALVLERTGTAGLTGVVVAATIAPWAGIGQWLSARADRYRRRDVLVVCDVARAVIFLSVAAAPDLPIPVVIALAFLSGCFDPPFESTASAVIADASPPAIYPQSVALSSSIQQVGLLVGYASGGFLVGGFSPRTALLVNAMTFLVSAALLVNISSPDHRDRSVDGVSGTSVRGALRFVASDPWIVLPLTSFSVVAFAGMAAEGVVVGYSDAVGVPGGVVGFVAASVAAATLVGMLVPRHGTDVYASVRLANGFVLAGAVLAGIGFSVAPRWWPAAFLAYAGIGLMFASSPPLNAIAGMRIPSEIRSAVFGVIGGAVMASHALGSAAGGGLAIVVGVETAVLVAVGIAAVVPFATAAAVRAVPEPGEVLG